MAKTITFECEGKEYTLEFTRNTVRMMEQQGFRVSDIDGKPMTTLPQLFAGAFLAHHRFLKREVIDGIFERMPDKLNLMNKLAEMYNDPIASLVDEPEEAAGNLKWDASW